MLIDNQILNIQELKDMFDLIDWRFAPRKLSQEHTDFFYTGKYEDSDRIIEIRIRPSKIMAISESFKNRTINGDIAPANYAGIKVNWGSSVEVRVDDSFFNKVKEIAKAIEPYKSQVVSWE